MSLFFKSADQIRKVADHEHDKCQHIFTAHPHISFSIRFPKLKKLLQKSRVDQNCKEYTQQLTEPCSQ